MLEAKRLDKRLVADLTWVEFADRVDKNYIFMIPTGAIEEHGPHLPLSLDTVTALEIALRIANSYPAVVMPPLGYGYRSQTACGGGDLFPGTTSLSAEALIFTVRDVLLELLRHGVKRIVFTNGHLENVSFIIEGIELARRACSLADAMILFTSWDQYVNNSTLDEIFNGKFPGWEYEHAAINETSLLLALSPESVDLSKLPDEKVPRTVNYTVFPPPEDIVTRNGALSPATGSSKEIGERILKDVWIGYEKTFEKEFGLLPKKPLTI